jgi:plasmid stabilization system protein ParE
MKPLRVLEAARREANAATVWYMERSQAAARRFRDELLAGLASAASAPLSHPVYMQETRRVFLKRFPYFIVYFVGREEIYVVAIAHARRRPGYWEHRVL